MWPLSPPYTVTLVGLDDHQVIEALENGPAFLLQEWPAGVTTLLEVHEGPRTARIVINRDQESCFFETWDHDVFSEPFYHLQDALQSAKDLLT